MPKKPPRRSVSQADVEKLEQDLPACSERLAQLERAVEINIKRMGSMQAEIDHLRARSQT